MFFRADRVPFKFKKDERPTAIKRSNDLFIKMRHFVVLALCLVLAQANTPDRHQTRSPGHPKKPKEDPHFLIKSIENAEANRKQNRTGDARMRSIEEDETKGPVGVPGGKGKLNPGQLVKIDKAHRIEIDRLIEERRTDRYSYISKLWAGTIQVVDGKLVLSTTGLWIV